MEESEQKANVIVVEIDTKSLTNEEIIALWGDYEKCPDFLPVLKGLLKERKQDEVS